eukprot:2097340-Amphidinium_carterae.1
MVSNLCEGQRTASTPSTGSQRTISDTVGLCLHKIEHSDSKEMAGSYSLDLHRDNDRTLHGNSYIPQGSDATSADAIEEVRDGEWLCHGDIQQRTHIKDKVQLNVYIKHS